MKGQIPNKVYSTYINRYTELWDHTMMRVHNAEAKSNGDYQKFVNQMVTRLKRITHEDKLHYAIAVLQYLGYDELVDIYEGKILMDAMTRQMF